ncbi:MAG: exodeoxyribonuclease VII small subunit [Anaerolineaceae bacterium]|nr:exodeoxyribonuclease VII small subunit [Anaerolineaceae bacterium]
MQSEPALSFEAAFAELESTLAQLESDSLPLEQALAMYQRGSQLAQYCQSLLDSAEQRLEVLEQGNPGQQSRQ